MLRAWRNELLCVAGVGLGLLLLALFVGEVEVLLGAGLIAYLGWHTFNLILLQRWVGRGRGSRLPVSLGVWEGVFDGLQRRQLRDRRRRRALAQTLTEFRGAGARLPDALVVLDDDNRILWFNAAAERLLALKRPRDLGQDVTGLVRHPALADALAGAGSGRPLEIVSPVNAAWMLSLQATASFGRDRRRMLVARDITRFYRVERIRRDFVANVSHELRTPLTVFRGYIDALQDAVIPPDWARPIEQMDQQAQRMQALVDDLLHLSHLELAGRSEPSDIVPVSEILESIVEQARALSGPKSHDLILSADPTVNLLAQKEELRGAFSNLVFNAVRHTPPGTRVEVSWDGGRDHASLTVRDFGQGIAAEHLPRLTDRFYRVEASRSRNGGGTGLGLAIAKHALERCGGDLRIDSVLGRGSTFSCHFPGARVDICPTKPADTDGFSKPGRAMSGFGPTPSTMQNCKNMTVP